MPFCIAASAFSTLPLGKSTPRQASRTSVTRKPSRRNDGSYVAVGRWFNACVLAMPVIFVVIFGWWVWQAASWYPRTWKENGAWMRMFQNAREWCEKEVLGEK